MKKVLFVLILILGIVYGVFCQNSGPMDLVVLLDTSTSMSSTYKETSEYLIGPFLREFLRIGDTFHLISYADSPRVEISRRIEAVGDVEAIIGRILLMYPLYPRSNLSGALNYAESYSSSLPGDRHRRLILVSDGDAPGTQNLVDASTNRLRNIGTEFQYIKVPVTGNGPSSGRPQVSVPAQTVAAAPPAPTVQAAVPSQSQSSVTSATATQGQSQSTTQTTEQTRTQAPAAGSVDSAVDSGKTSSSGSVGQTGQETGSSTTSSPAPSSSTTGSSTTGSSSASSSSTSGTTQSTQSASTPAQAPVQTQSSAASREPLFSGDIPLPLLIALILLALLILGLIIFLAARRLQNSPNRVMAQAAAPDYSDRVEAERQSQIKGAEMMGSFAQNQKNQRKPLPKDQIDEPPAAEESEGPLMLNLFVEDQNTAIGRRNIHALKSGYTYSVGGGKSDFLIFLVPISPHIADVQISGNNCTFVPRKPEYFPDIGSQSVPNAIGKSIRVISDKNYELHIRMDRYEDPLKKLNKMLHSISVPG